VIDFAADFRPSDRPQFFARPPSMVMAAGKVDLVRARRNGRIAMLANQGHRAGQMLAIGAAFLLILSAITPANAQTPGFDGRGWTVGHRQSNGNQTLIEYVLPGQNVENWRELATSQVFSPAVPLAPFVERLRASLSQGCPSLVWNVIRQEEKTLIYEWRDSGCGGFEPQYELGRITIEERSLYRLAYAIKTKKPLAAEKRSTWLEILSRVPLAEGTVSASADAPERTPGENPQATRALAERVKLSGLECPAGRRSEIKRQEPGPAGPLTVWLLECTNGAQYTVMVDPFGSVSAFPSK
jgi:hypothetical protein